MSNAIVSLLRTVGLNRWSEPPLRKTDLAVNDPPARCYAIVPAAGRSRRMGRPKLLLPWGDGLLIDQVLGAWTLSGVSDVIVVVRKDDSRLTEACRGRSARVVHPPTDPVDMKESVQNGLLAIEELCAPSPQDRCFIAPADLPTLTSEIVDRLIAAPSTPSRIVVPQFGDKQGHPALLPWPLTREIFDLGPRQGVDCVVKRHPKLAVPFDRKDLVMDVDTPDQYERLRELFDQNREA
jgi:molybdenum cofactor cytidylyltransferase